MEKKNERFETSMVRLEEIVRSLESGNADLDGALALYEEGVGLARGCAKMLDEAEKKIKILSGSDMSEKDFDPDDEK